MRRLRSRLGGGDDVGLGAGRAHGGHIADGNGLARDGGLANACFLEENFTRLAELDLPDFDFITFQGVWSWIDDDLRGRIGAFIQAKLRPGGVVMASYNALPGWAPIEPLRRMMLTFMEGRAGDTTARANEAITYLKFLRENGAAYFKDNPEANQALDAMDKTERCFIVHDYLPPSMKPFYFADVMHAMKDAGLDFAGCYPASLNYPKFTTRQAFHSFLESLGTRMALESHKDFINNTRFRTDVFVKADARPLPAPERCRLLEDFRFGSFENCREIPERVTLGPYDIEYAAPIYRPLMDALAGGSPSIGEIAATNALGGFSADDIANAVNLLVLGGHFRPFAAPTNGAAGHGSNGVLNPLNRALLNRQIDRTDPIFLASPVVGSAMPFPAFAGLLIQAFDRVGALEAPMQVWHHLAARGQSLESDGGALSGQAAHLDAIRSEVADLVCGQADKLAALGVADLAAQAGITPADISPEEAPRDSPVT